MKNNYIEFLKQLFLYYNFKFFGILFLLGVPLFTIYRIAFFLKYAYRIDFKEISSSTILWGYEIFTIKNPASFRSYRPIKHPLLYIKKAATAP